LFRSQCHDRDTNWQGLRGLWKDLCIKDGAIMQVDIDVISNLIIDNTHLSITGDVLAHLEPWFFEPVSRRARHLLSSITGCSSTWAFKGEPCTPSSPSSPFYHLPIAQQIITSIVNHDSHMRCCCCRSEKHGYAYIDASRQCNALAHVLDVQENLIRILLLALARPRTALAKVSGSLDVLACLHSYRVIVYWSSASVIDGTEKPTEDEFNKITRFLGMTQSVCHPF